MQRDKRPAFKGQEDSSAKRRAMLAQIANERKNLQTKLEQTQVVTAPTAGTAVAEPLQ